MTDPTQDRLRRLPKVDLILEHENLGEWRDSPLALAMIRELLQETRELALRDGDTIIPDAADVARLAREQLDRRFRSPLRRVINGTGILVHTNFGRAPLSEAALAAISDIAHGYSSLEYDLDHGRRGSRHDLVRESLVALSGAEDALVVNNNAAALLLALTAFAKRKEVIVSRGQLVEIGGSFRIPDICRVSGAKLVEVGTTNRTRLSDYERAINPRTGLILRVHPSNFRISGFTESVPLHELAALGLKHGLPVLDDLGSGAFADVSEHTPLPREPLVHESVEAGADVITFSGDKLLGGPQAGIAVGGPEPIGRMRRHPLMRALRPGKLTFAALGATLFPYLTRTHTRELPVWRMMSATVAELETWLRPIRQEILRVAESQSLTVAIQPSTAYFGGGSLPQEELASAALVFSGPQRRLNALQTRLRLADVPLIGYLKDGGFHLDARTLFLLESPDEITVLLRVGLEGSS